MTQWLSKINEPADLRGLKLKQLKEVCGELREEILRVMAINGGHLASSLGAVELAVALHHVFETPRDRLVWDVGHQAYAHKILTGRRERFSTIRKDDGLSGFLKRAESPYDAFGAGHASTSISAALGMAVARDRLEENYKVVSITGDGAMTGGMCYEALNNAGNLKADLLIVLNDNRMSISKNTGALSSYFNKIVMTHFYNERRKEIVDFIRRMPAGESVARIGHKLEESVKGLILPGIFFEDLGIRYLGPIDGHDLDVLVPALKKVRSFKGPILLHVITVKGKGRPYSEADPITWHSPPLNFKVESGEAPPAKPGPPSYSGVFVSALRDLARDDKKIVALSAAMLEGTELTKFEKEFPERTYDVGIAEEHAVTCAAGMACDGLRPFVCIYSTFLQRALDQIVHDVAIQNLPVVFSLDRAGLVGADGPTHHGVFDLTYLRMIPNMVVMAPMDARELRHMTYTAHQYAGGPIALRFPRGKASGDFDADEPFKLLPIGKGEELREGDEACLIGIGNMTGHALKAAELLEEEGISVGVVNARFVKPLDRQLLADLAKRYSHLITIEDNVKAGGFGSAVNEALEEIGATQRAHVLGVPDQFIHHGSLDRLYQECGISPVAIAGTVRRLLKPKRTAIVRSLLNRGATGTARKTEVKRKEPALASASGSSKGKSR